MPINPKIFRTSTFRLAAVYLLVFVLSVAAVLGYVYWNTVGLLERQTDETIRAEVQGLSEQYRQRGVRGIAEVIQRRSLADNATVYLLTDPGGRAMFGNLANLPVEAGSEPGWIDFPLALQKPGSNVPHTGRAYHTSLTGGYHLLVGRDVQELRQFGKIIRRALFVALGLALALGLGGALLTSRNFLRRVDDITGTSKNIMEGDLTRRMPVAGTGDEMDRLAVSLNEMLDQIERLMNGMKEVTGNVAHDLKTPLTRLRARVEAALRTGDKSEYKKALDQTIEESDELLRTFNALLSIARAEAGQSREGLQLVELNPILQDVTELYEPLVEDAGGTLTSRTDGDIRVRADRQLIAQAVSNLMDNALKYGVNGSGAAVHVTSEVSGKNAVVTVSDTGTGIPEADRERVKERFVRLDASRTKPGNGLGLSLVSSVMKLHGGQLILEDNQPGLRAKLVLPLAAAAG